MIRPQWVRLGLIITCSFVLAAPTVARADTESCPTYNDILSLSLRASLDVVAPRMTASCGDDAISTGLYGGLLLRAGAVADAVVWLEKSLLLDPNQRGVRADYALALSSLGDAESSRELATDLLDAGDVPEALSNVLDSLVSVDEWSVDGQFSVTGGYSDNIDYVAELSSLDLTFGEDGVTTFSLAEDSVATAAAFFQQSMSLSGTYQTERLSVEPSIGLTERRAAESEVSDYSAGQLGLRIESGSSSAFVGWGSTDYGIGLDREDTRVAISHGLIAGLDESTCQPGVRAELWQQRYPDVTAFDADVTRLGLWLTCKSGWQAAVFMTRDNAVGDRIGGDRDGIEWQVGRSIPVRSGRLRLDLSMSRERDTEGYSDFLLRGDARQLTTVQGTAEWVVPLTPSVSVAASAVVLRQRSNLALFDVSANELALSLIYSPD